MRRTDLNLDDPSLFSLLSDPLVVLDEIATLLAQADTDAGWFRPALQLAANACGAERAALFLLDQDRLDHADSWPARAAEHDLHPLAAWTAARGETIHLPCVGRCEQPPLLTDGTNAVVTPVRAGERILGALIVARTGGMPGFDEDDRRLLERVSRHIAVGVDRTLARREVARRARAALREVGDALEAYARDVRETYTQEKFRAAELRDALTELERTYLATVRGLAIAVEAKDAYTAGHLTRVTRYGMALVEVLDPAKGADQQLEYGFLLHDIGKLAVPDAILQKAGSLTAEEWAVLREHPAVGRRILADIPFLSGALEIVYAHHERWDGQGYPEGIGGEDLTFGARLFPLVDALDAMTSDRPYRKGMPMAVARDRLAEASGTQFWPEAVAALMEIPVARLEALRCDPRDADGPAK